MEEIVIKIYNTENMLEANQILELLKENGVRAYKQGVGMGYNMASESNFLGSNCNVNIFVHEEDLEKATELLQVIVPDFELEKKEIAPPEINSDKKGLKIISGTILVLVLAVMLLYYLL